MSKRDHFDFSQNTSSQISSQAKRKKLNSSDALAILLDHSDELVHCINTLKASGVRSGGENGDEPGSVLISTDPAVCERLAMVITQLLPSLQVLSSQARTENHAAARAEKSLAIPELSFLTKWTSAEIPKSLPPLPAVDNAVVEASALTHKSVLGTHDSINKSCERLEWLGDAYLELIATSLIYQTFEEIDPGQVSLVRETLVRNLTLSQYALDYGLDKRATLPSEFFHDRVGGGTKIGEKGRIKILGDIFEAYVGAIIAADPQHGVSRVSSWLKALWGMKLKERIREEERRLKSAEVLSGPGRAQVGESAKRSRPKQTPKEQLAQQLVVTGISLRYEDLPPPRKKTKENNLPLFAIGVFMDGWGEKNLQLGAGVAPGKKEAGNRAAQAALDNKKLMKLYSGKKMDFLAASGKPADDPL